jgi:HEPN domain-containing protein
MSIDEVKRWLDFSESDLIAAKTLLNATSNHSRQVCYLSQQAAEKALKAVLIYTQTVFPFTHDLDRLRECIPNGWRIKIAYPNLYSLTIWAVESRYPGDMPEITTTDAQDSILMAEGIFQLINEEFKERLTKNVS